MKTDVQFLGGVTRADDVARLKLGNAPRIVFAGRSNVGKSSLLNAITKTKIARVSQEPGRTREMNFFRYRDWIFVDLPGYGFAKVSKSLKQQWGKEITLWLQNEEQLQKVILLVDGRHGFFEQDLELLAFLQSNEIPHLVAFTKMDKWKSNNQKSQAVSKLKMQAAEFSVQEFCFVSSIEKSGTKDLFIAINNG